VGGPGARASPSPCASPRPSPRLHPAPPPLQQWQQPGGGGGHEPLDDDLYDDLIEESRQMQAEAAGCGFGADDQDFGAGPMDEDEPAQQRQRQQQQQQRQQQQQQQQWRAPGLAGRGSAAAGALDLDAEQDALFDALGEGGRAAPAAAAAAGAKRPAAAGPKAPAEESPNSKRQKLGVRPARAALPCLRACTACVLLAVLGAHLTPHRPSRRGQEAAQPPRAAGARPTFPPAGRPCPRPPPSTRPALRLPPILAESLLAEVKARPAPTFWPPAKFASAVSGECLAVTSLLGQRVFCAVAGKEAAGRPDSRRWAVRLLLLPLLPLAGGLCVVLAGARGRPVAHLAAGPAAGQRLA
jgi:hypothetical protein